MSTKGFQYGKSNHNPNIAMPDVGEISPIDKLTNPGARAHEQVELAQADTPAFNNVPDEVPEETLQALQEDEVEDIEEVEEEVEEVEPVKQVKTNKDSFAELRRAREMAEAKAEKAERERDLFMQQLFESQSKSKSKKEEIVEDYEINLADDDLVAGKDVRKVDARTRALEKKLAQYEAQSKEAAAEARVRARCPDIDSVVTDENIYLLRQTNPDLAHSLSLAPDSWDKLAGVYAAIKSTGIHKNKTYESDKMKAVANIKKPRPTASVSPQQGDTPLSGVNAFVTDYKMNADAKKATWKEMQQAMKGS